MTSPLPKLSIVIPVFEEALEIDRLLEGLPDAPGIEILFIDGGSQDPTVQLLRGAGRTVLIGEKGRARQMNLGAHHARSEHLLFLHADSALEPGAMDALQAALDRPECIGGAFRLKIRTRSSALRVVERGVWWRCQLLRSPYGDQGLFLRQETFRSLGGYADLDLMEDLDLVRRMKKRGRLTLLQQTISTSDRRWRRNGVWRTTLLNSLLAALFHCGVPVPWLARVHTRLSDSAHGKAILRSEPYCDEQNADRGHDVIPSSTLDK